MPDSAVVGMLPAYLERVLSFGKHSAGGIQDGTHLGCLRIRAFTSDRQWFQLQLPECWGGVHITVKELLPIVLGVAVWVSGWKGLTVTCRVTKQRW